MNSKKIVCIEKIKSEGEYLIKDNIGISIGRLFILDNNISSKSLLVRLKFYKQERSDLILASLKEILTEFFNGNEVYRLNIMVEEDFNLTPFIVLGFNLEGILENKTILNTKVKDEFIFGISAYDYRNQDSRNIFILKGNKVTLKLLTPENYKEVLQYNLRNKEHLKKFEPLRDENFYTEEVQRNILMESYKQYLNGATLVLGIYKENEFVGKIQLSNIVQGIFKNAFLGYSIDKDFEGKGFMKEAVKMVIDYAFTDMELHRIEASTLVDNKRSQGVLKACGFEELGLNKDYLYINGSWRDHITFFKINKGIY
ncbi:GNAT family N-acetyltransferase [Clostridium sp. MSJ-4]|uniref:GNAT family N-acetyltransferase n=1 Tax=Clostridium simiarum TaxID=2841506 RepID=A0ABS6F4L3_9CLOT|nr:GNAT family protein [Clostridium simiarum]MBU5593459.1 GNAT family N-acetyltransferase [Clostridium simiarum]